MNSEEYDKIISTIHKYKCINIHCVDDLENKFPNVKHGTLNSILSNETQKLTKLNYSRAQEDASYLYDKYEEAVRNREAPGIIIRLAQWKSIPFAMAAKLILTEHVIDTDHREHIDSNISLTVKKQLRDTTLIQDKTLAYEVFMCTIYDNEYSPSSEVIRMNLGQQYEIKLYKQMEKQGILYRNEVHLRKFGFDKTPDVKLEMPIAIDGFIVHWIESKARFGDREVHQEYVRNQYISYWNRFGPGLIIYWFGFLDVIEADADRRFIIRDRLPRDAAKLNE